VRTNVAASILLVVLGPLCSWIRVLGLYSLLLSESSRNTFDTAVYITYLWFGDSKGSQD
jgi:hypothetical protein